MCFPRSKTSQPKNEKLFESTFSFCLIDEERHSLQEKLSKLAWVVDEGISRHTYKERSLRCLTKLEENVEEKSKWCWVNPNIYSSSSSSSLKPRDNRLTETLWQEFRSVLEEEKSFVRILWKKIWTEKCISFTVMLVLWDARLHVSCDFHVKTSLTVTSLW